MEGAFNVHLGLQMLSNSFCPLYSSGMSLTDFGNENLGKCRRIHGLLGHSLDHS